MSKDNEVETKNQSFGGETATDATPSPSYIVDALALEIKKLKTQSTDLKIEFDKLEKKQDKATSFVLNITSFMGAIFVITVILIALDYWKYNQDRYEKFIDKTEEIKNGFYTKVEIDGRLILKENKSEVDEIRNCVSNFGVDYKCFE